MIDLFCLGIALTVGQMGPEEPILVSPPELPRHMALPNVPAPEGKLIRPAADSKLLVQAPGRTSIDLIPIQPPAAPSQLPAVGTPAVTAPASPMPVARPIVSSPAVTTIPGVQPRVPAAPIRAQPRNFQMVPVQNGGAPVAAPVPGTAAPEVSSAPAVTSTAAPCATCAPAAEAEAPKEPEEKAFFMSLLEGTGLGKTLDDHGITIGGWTQMSFTGSSAKKTNLPVTWNDRANRFLLQQHWLNIEKALDTEKKEFHYGWKVSALFGTDYRFTTIRGLFNSQLKNNRPNGDELNGFQQNLYGADLPLFYMNFWMPNLMEGTELRIGRMYTPWGYESVEATATPLLSRSYGFNWAPPFFHMGIMLAPNITKNLSGKFMLANGNDVFFDGSQELRFVGNLTWTSDDKKDSFAVSTSLGRGKFNAARPNPGITTTGLAWETVGRNNFNAFDILWTHAINDDLTYAAEAIYGYQTAVPAAATGNVNNFGGAAGTANWFSVANYFTYNICEKLSSVLRLEVFEDSQGQRTGFEGTYYAGTLGFQWKPTKSIMMRPEVRYDYNAYSTPFGGKHGIITAATDLIFRW